MLLINPRGISFTRNVGAYISKISVNMIVEVIRVSYLLITSDSIWLSDRAAWQAIERGRERESARANRGECEERERNRLPQRCKIGTSAKRLDVK